MKNNLYLMMNIQNSELLQQAISSSSSSGIVSVINDQHDTNHQQQQQQQQQQNFLDESKNNQTVDNDLDDIDSNDGDLDDDDLDAENNKNKQSGNVNLRNNISSMNSNASGIANNAALFIEDDKRKRRAIANSNERRRMQSINAGFQTLKSLIPHSNGEKLSKACILQRSADFMQFLSNEKDKLNAKLQIALKLMEQQDNNALYAQYQAKVNNLNENSVCLTQNNSTNSNVSASSTTTTTTTTAMTNQQTASGFLVSSSSMSTLKSASSTKINKQVFYMSSMPAASSVNLLPTQQSPKTVVVSTEPIALADCTNEQISSVIQLKLNTSNGTTNNTNNIEQPKKQTSNVINSTVVSLASPPPQPSSPPPSLLIHAQIQQSGSENNLVQTLDNSLVKNTGKIETDNEISMGLPQTSGKNISNLSILMNDSIRVSVDSTNNVGFESKPLLIPISSSSTVTTITRQLSDTTNLKHLQETNPNSNNSFLLVQQQQQQQQSFTSNNSIQAHLLQSTTNISNLQAFSFDTMNIYNGINPTVVLSTTHSPAQSSTIVSNKQQNELSNNQELNLSVKTNKCIDSISSPSANKSVDLSAGVKVNRIEINEQNNKCFLDSDQAGENVFSGQLLNKLNSKLKQENSPAELLTLLNELKNKKNASLILSTLLAQSGSTNEISLGSAIKSSTQLTNDTASKALLLHRLLSINGEKLVNLDKKRPNETSENVSDEEDENEEDQDEEMIINDDEYGQSKPLDNVNLIPTSIQLENSNKLKTLNFAELNLGVPLPPPHNSLKTQSTFKSSRSNSIDQLIAAAAVTAHSSACMSPLSPLHSPQQQPQQQQQQQQHKQSSKPSLKNNLLSASSNDQNNETTSLTCSTDELSVSRKNLNTIVEAIFHVEGKNLLDDLVVSQPLPTSQQPIQTLLLPVSSTSSKLNENLTTQENVPQVLNASSLLSQSQTVYSSKITQQQQQQQQKPPKKRKYTTEDISQTFLSDQSLPLISSGQETHPNPEYESSSSSLSLSSANKIKKLNETSLNKLLIANNNRKQPTLADQAYTNPSPSNQMQQQTAILILNNNESNNFYAASKETPVQNSYLFNKEGPCLNSSIGNNQISTENDANNLKANANKQTSSSNSNLVGLLVTS